MLHRSPVSLLALCCAFGAAASLQSNDASACGGLFCNAASPVNQAAERIIFAENDDGTVTAAIEVQYEGPAEAFAWVLPVPPGEVDIGVSSKLALDRLDSQTNPSYQLNVTFEDGCAPPPIAVADGAFAGAPMTSAPQEESPAEPEVVVLEEGNAGPYDYAIIAVNEDLDDRAQVAIDWLTDNGYDVGELGPDVLRPYLDGDMNLVAFRLTKGSDAGSIRPIMLTYESEQPFIPIRPTAVAANDDMGVKVWVLGQSRAIPENYLHLEINEALINWFNPNSNYNDVIIAAADEAGGHGFVTEQAGAAGGFAQVIYTGADDAQWEQLRTGTFGSMQQFLQTAVSAFGSHDGFLDVLRNSDVVPLRDGATAEQFVACVSCYFAEDVAVRNEAYPETPFDPETDPLLGMSVPDFLGEMDALVIAPLQDTSALFEQNSTVTRMYTTLSADEMTVDPAFTFNPELEDVSNIHVADQIMQCTPDEPEWRIELPQGTTVVGDGRVWPVDFDSGMPANLRVLQLSTSGDGMPVEDNAAAIGALLADLGVGEAGPELMAEDPENLDPEQDPAEDPMADPNVDPGPGNQEPGEEVDGEPMDTPGPTSEEPDIDEDDGSSEEDDVPGLDAEDGMMASSSAGSSGCALTPSTPGGNGWAWLGLAGLALLRRRRQ